MRIIGGKDYYDHGLVYGVDESVVLVRTGHPLVCDVDFPVEATGGAPGVAMLERNGGTPPDPGRNVYGPRRLDWSHGGCDFKVSGVHVVFCGRYYSGARVRYISSANAMKDSDHVENGDSIPYRRWTSETFWDMNSLGKFLAKHGARVSNKRPTGLFRRDSMDPDRRPFSSRVLRGQELTGILQAGVAVATLTDDIVKDDRYGDKMQYRDPKRSRDRRAWRVNEATLGALDFIKVMDPYKAFQELQMWVGGVLPRPGNPMVQITDDRVKLAKHGFDSKLSFRKAPEKVR